MSGVVASGVSVFVSFGQFEQDHCPFLIVDVIEQPVRTDP